MRFWLEIWLSYCLPLCIYSGWVDPSTPISALHTKSHKDGRTYSIVMSDEFEVDDRSFADGDDPTWTASDHSDDARTSSNKGALIHYNSSYVGTRKGKLNITTTSELTRWKGYNPFARKYGFFEKQFRGGMITSWNKFCFSGGVVELSVKMPGRWDVSGLWPAFWLMGNLGRATYEQTTNMIWPWSFDICNRELQPAQELSGCSPTRHWDMHAHQGRGATEIDILEVMPGKKEMQERDVGVGLPYVSTTLQVSPGIRNNRPVPGKPISTGRDWKWYDGLSFGNTTKMNEYFYGTLLDETKADEPAGRSVRQVYQADALSALTPLSESLWEEYHTFRLEWMPGPQGYLAWYLDDNFLYEIPGRSLQDATGSQVPEEPSYLIINTAVSSTWGFPIECPEGCSCSCFDCAKAECRCGMPAGLCEELPASMLIDWVRVYQLRGEDRHFVGCDHPRFPTRKYIKAHAWRYMRDNEKEPLMKVHAGGARCRAHDECQPGGECDSRRRRCKCEDGWTGPRCKQPSYRDDFVRRVPTAVFSGGFDATWAARGVFTALAIFFTVGLALRLKTGPHG